MKRILLFIAVVVTSLCAYSQTDGGYLNENIRPAPELIVTDDTPQNPRSIIMRKDAYKHTPEWGKYKALRAVGWTSFGVGVTATLVGGYLYLFVANTHGSDSSRPLLIPFYTGLGLTAASVPILVSAYHYRNKAKKIGMNMGMTRLSTPSVGQNMSYAPAMSLILTF